MRSTLNLDPVLQMQISNSFWCICKLFMQNGLGNVFCTMCLVAFACVGATHFSIRIFAKHAVGDESWCVWGFVFAVVGGSFLQCIPHWFGKVCSEI